MQSVPRDLSLRVFHRLGTNQLVVSLQILEGEDAFTRILQTFRRAQLPSCFLRATLEHVALAIRESLSEETEATSRDASKVPFDRLHFADPLPLLDDLKTFKRSEEPHSLQLRGLIPPDSCPWGLQFTSGASMTFWCAYDFLLRHRPVFFRTIGTLEESYLQAIRELFVGRSVAVSELQRCQSIEMERLRHERERCGSGESESLPDVQVLVGQHVSEIDALERHWQSEIEQLKLKQKVSYRGLVVDFFEQEVLDGGETDEAQSVAAEVPKSAYLACPLRPNAWMEPESVEQAEETDSRLSKLSEVRATFGRNVFVVLRLYVGDVMEFAGGVTETSAAKDADGAGPQIPSDFLGIDGYRCDSYASSSAAFQSQEPKIQAAPVSRETRTFFQSASLHFWQSQSLPRLQLSPNAYSNRLRALIIPTPANLQFDTVQVSMLRDFAARCQRMTDFHFPPLKEQFETVKGASPVFRPGDYFCTRHSNLGGRLHAAFHLVVPADAHSADELPPSLHRALQRICSDCHQCHVAELTLPLLLLDIGTSDTSLPFAVAQRRAEQSLRALKSALTELADELSPYESPGLNVVNLVLPISALQSVAKGTPSVASSTQSFLQNSFQCV